MNLELIQKALRDQQVDGWLFYDHHHRDPIASRILGLSEPTHVSRRWYYLIPTHGEPRKLTHRVESGKLESLPGSGQVYSSWQELETGLRTMLKPYTRLAMQYSPRNAIMYVSLIDAGTIEVLRELGKTIVSSADLVSRFEAVLTAEHMAARHKSGAGLNEYEMMCWLQDAMRSAGIADGYGPNVSVNENSSDSHYEPTAAAW